MTTSQQAIYGSWRSPITADLVASSSCGMSQIKVMDSHIYWLEGRPNEAGRQVIMRYSLQDGSVQTMTPTGFNVRTRVHEYGGGDYLVDGDTIYFINDKDQRYYRQKLGKKPVAITPAPAKPLALRYADGVISPNHEYIICVRETHLGNSVVNELVAIRTNGNGVIKIIATGYDFYSSPCLNSKGDRLVWIAWNHPQMPWDGTELWVADFNLDATIKNSNLIAGGKEESIYQPSWSSKNELYFVSDRSGWWNLYKIEQGRITCIVSEEAEFGYPAWIFATNTYAFIDENIVCILSSKGTQQIGIIQENKFKAFEIPYDEIAPYIDVDKEGNVFFIGADATTAPVLVRYQISTKQFQVLYKSSKVTIDKKYLSTPETIEFPTDENQTAYAFYYSPHNDDYCAPDDERPPLLVMSHGGPTAATNTALNLKIQYWTSRGFAVVDVNYRGSTGYGRAYRDQLKGQWGIVDVADCVNAAKYLIARDEVDPKRLAIRGGSAGGYTTLCALVFYDTFAAGASYYGVADLKGIATDSHKFESRYLDSLVGPYPEASKIYEERSPLNYPDRIACPIIFFQGLEDKVVPPQQAEVMIEALQQKGLSYAYITFEHEQHGFRDANNIKKAIKAELYFYSKIFDFMPADDLPEIEIVAL